MKNIEKMLNDELDSIVPEMSENLRNYPISTNPIYKKSFNFRLIPAFCLPVLIICIALVFIFKPNPKQEINQWYLLEVNPSILVTTDNDRVVTSIKSANSDADIVIAGLDLDTLIGEELSKVAEVIADELLQLGYLSNESDNKLTINSSNVEDNYLEDVFVEYFCKKGYFVNVSNLEFDVEKYNKKYNESISSINDFVERIKDMTVSYYEKYNSYSFEDILDLYKQEYIDQSSLKTKVEESINNKLTDLVNKSEILNNMVKTCNEIFSNGDFMINDYWIIKKYVPEEQLNDEIKQLIASMDKLISDYHELTFVKINSHDDIINELSYVTIQIKKLQEFDYTSNNKFDEMKNSLIGLLDKEEIDDIFDMPSDISQFISKLKEEANQKSDHRKHEHRGSYEEHKDSISRDEYEDFRKNPNKRPR